MRPSITSSKLQDIEATIEILNKAGKNMKFIYMIGVVPYLALKGFSTKKWLHILKFERRIEIERIKFYKKIMSNNIK